MPKSQVVYTRRCKRCGSEISVPELKTEKGLPIIAVSVSDAMEMTGLGKHKLYEAAASGRIKNKRDGKRVVLLVESLLNSDA